MFIIVLVFLRSNFFRLCINRFRQLQLTCETDACEESRCRFRLFSILQSNPRGENAVSVAQLTLQINALAYVFRSLSLSLFRSLSHARDSLQRQLLAERWNTYVLTSGFRYFAGRSSTRHRFALEIESPWRRRAREPLLASLPCVESYLSLF